MSPVKTEQLFIELAEHAAVIGPLLSLHASGSVQGASDVRALAVRIGLGSARLPEVAAALEAAERVGAMVSAGELWSVTLSGADCRELATLLRGARLYREQVHEDRDLVQVVISMPPAPSQLVEALQRTLEGAWGMETTESMLGRMAEGARDRFTVMTPFVDEDGARRVVALLAATRPGVRRELIVRAGLPAPLAPHAATLKDLGVAVFDFRIPRAGAYESETFHAKVIRVDHSECYVGSSNMTRWSFDYSLELGLHVRGQAARTVSRVLDAVQAASVPIFVPR